MKINSVLLTILTISIFITIPAITRSQALREAVTDSGKSGQIIIRHTDRFNLVNKEGIATLSGNVEITFLSGDVNTRWDNMTLNCDTLLIYYETNEKTEDTGDINGTIDRMLATGDVRISQPDGSMFTAEKGEYFHSEEKIDLTGNPVFRRGESLIKGSKLTIELNADMISGEDIEASLFLNEEGE